MIAAVLLAAGESRRMGRPKLTLPWGPGGSVVSQVVARFREAGADPVLVVTGGDRKEVERALDDSGVHCLFNPNYRQGGMLSSIKVGLGRLLGGDAEAALV
ncbi:MAG TPA: NTP transferase domain-containing protein, partial [Anaerolineales bacterium]|nr:NTP transferase domain-containing protein [Anaerolineales bacterium]